MAKKLISKRLTPAGKRLKLTDAHRMLLDVRDTLYDGSWDEFRFDLQARATDKPHVFETVPTSAKMLDTIRDHLNLIDEMSRWERINKRRLTSSTD